MLLCQGVEGGSKLTLENKSGYRSLIRDLWWAILAELARMAWADMADLRRGGLLETGQPAQAERDE